jgi:hypothetical protein
MTNNVKLMQLIHNPFEDIGEVWCSNAMDAAFLRESVFIESEGSSHKIVLNI